LAVDGWESLGDIDKRCVTGLLDDMQVVTGQGEQDKDRVKRGGAWSESELR
jgi:hypothetical protein